MTDYRCPICGVELEPSARYPAYVCRSCAARATDSTGRALEFGNIGFGGGYDASYIDTGEPYDSHVCYIDGVKCHADEARFGGIVIEVLRDTPPKIVKIPPEELAAIDTNSLAREGKWMPSDPNGTDLEPDQVLCYLAMGARIPQNDYERRLLEGIKEIPPGHVLEIPFM